MPLKTTILFKTGIQRKMMEENVSLMKPLVLAYIGDSVYSVYVKKRIIEEIPGNVFKLHLKTCEYVKAAAQAETVKYLWDDLSENEQNIVKRGRNAHSHTVPKNADVTDYRFATGFEALIGFLYLDGQNERLEEIMKKAYDHITDKEHEGENE